ncbi:hypothetical protein [Flavobacterium capsici]|uniref:Uncharacterized protein n=1 Tax=Flavobacterium capsici TaxID=3075618 RepID=A0AA96F6U7_9FLAO|nr:MULTISPECIES: hypothetical protein [unclassified Flavobacterium]WNM18634.1 hypothetical protein RN608_11510 [Flavobacterium sp. PMR2A8]WNM22685.1 hypothetical protein RN605_04810 [Flavobacterium sp. PMTSA4]
MIGIIEVNTAPHKLSITYQTDLTSIGDISTSDLKDLIKIQYEPLYPSFKEDFVNVFKEFENDIMDKVKHIIESNKELYKHFNIPLKFDESFTVTLDSNNIESHKFIKATRYLNISINTKNKC